MSLRLGPGGAGPAAPSSPPASAAVTFLGGMCGVHKGEKVKRVNLADSQMLSEREGQRVVHEGEHVKVVHEGTGTGSSCGSVLEVVEHVTQLETR